MKNLFQVQKESYPKRALESLAAFAANVAHRISSDPAYQAYLTAANALKALAGQFKTAFLAKLRTEQLVLNKPVLARTCKDTTSFERFIAEVYFALEEREQRPEVGYKLSLSK